MITAEGYSKGHRIKMVKQPEGSAICGQCCVAMATGKPIEDVFKIFGHKHSTRTIQLHKALKKLGIKSGKKLIRYGFVSQGEILKLPEVAILKITYDWRKHTGHYVFYKKGTCFCPSGEVYHWTDHLRFPAMGRITSFLKLF